MVKCYFCYKADTESYWEYYCESCIKIKQFCKLIGSDKLCKSLQFKVNDEKLKKLTDEEMAEEKEEEEPAEAPELKDRHKGVKGLDPEATAEKVKSGPQKTRKSLRLDPKGQ